MCCFFFFVIKKKYVDTEAGEREWARGKMNFPFEGRSILAAPRTFCKRVSGRLVFSNTILT